MILEVKDLWKTFGSGETTTNALQGVYLTAEAGDFIAVVGPSGSGKSTLLHLIGAMDTPDKGEIFLEERNLRKLRNYQLTKLRLKRIGFIFQTFNLIPTLTTLENIMLPMKLAGVSARTAKERSVELMQKVDLEDRARHYPSQLSGGQKQRVAIARALANDPIFILADEPTGNLDSKNSEVIVGLLQELRNKKRVVIVVTHDTELAKAADKMLTIKDGMMVS